MDDTTQAVQENGPQREQTQYFASEEELYEGVPRFNIGALFLPPIWGPAYGQWISILFYPAWTVADTCFVNAITLHTPLAIAVGLIVFALLTYTTFKWSEVMQKYALCRSIERGKTKEQYLKDQKIWAVAAVIGGLALIAAATYYNLAINPAMLEFLGRAA